MNESILAIDPGTAESAYVVVDKDTLKPLDRGIIPNMEMLWAMQDKEFFDRYNIKHVVIEMIAGMGQSVGQETFETVFWIGCFWQEMRFNLPRTRIYRREEKSALCGTQKCKDRDIITALLNRFAPGEANYGKGTAKKPGWFYDFKEDIWQSYAVAVTYHDLYLTEEGRFKRIEAEAKRHQNKVKREAKKKNAKAKTR